tara:strand:+ start:351 stop:980 length:630 start_codon:yes stop_codon:yes gene_type:complete
MNNQSVNMNALVNLVNELKIQINELSDENKNLKSIINSQNNYTTLSNIDSITRDFNNYSFNTSETNLLSNNLNDINLEVTNPVQENLDTKSIQDNLEKNNYIKDNSDKFILYYYPSKNTNFPPFEYKFYIQDNAKYSIKNDIKIRGKHIKINTDSNSISASYFNNKKIDYINLYSKEFYELNPNISKNVEIFRNKNKKRFDKYNQDPDL